MPDWDKWHLGTSDRGLLLQHEIWREQVDLVRENMDPIGIFRGPAAEELIRVPAAQLSLDWEHGMQLFNMALEERLEKMPAMKATFKRSRGRD